MIFTTINTTGNEERYDSVYKAVTYLEVSYMFVLERLDTFLDVFYTISLLNYDTY